MQSEWLPGGKFEMGPIAKKQESPGLNKSIKTWPYWHQWHTPNYFNMARFQPWGEGAITINARKGNLLLVLSLIFYKKRKCFLFLVESPQHCCFLLHLKSRKNIVHFIFLSQNLSLKRLLRPQGPQQTTDDPVCFFLPFQSINRFQLMGCQEKAAFFVWLVGFAGG